MQALLFLLALYLGAVVADYPLIYQGYPDDSSSTSSSSEKADRLSSSGYLKEKFGNAPGMVDFSVYMDDGQAVSAASVLRLLRLEPRLLEAYLIAERVNLQKILDESRPNAVTVFAPTNEAIIEWKKRVPIEMTQDVAALTKLCRSWIVPGLALKSKDFSNNQLLPTASSNQAKLRINIYQNDEKKYTVNGARLLAPNYLMDGNVAHAVDKVIPIPDGNAFDILAKVDQFSKFVTLVKKAKLEKALAQPDAALTIFAPINQAFDQLAASVIDDLLANQTKLQRLLKYHVIPDVYYSAGISDGKSIDSLIASKIRFAIDDKITLNNGQAKIIISDLPAYNGVIQVVDRVITPPQSRMVYA